MDTPTHPFGTKNRTPLPNEEPALSTALWTLTGFLLFAAVIFALVIYGHF